MSLAEMLQDLPRYKCHKIVKSSKIVDMNQMPSGGAVIQLEDKEEPVTLMADFVFRHKPEVGMFIVVYEDDYVSVSPARAMELGYTRL